MSWLEILWAWADNFGFGFFLIAMSCGTAAGLLFAFSLEDLKGKSCFFGLAGSLGFFTVFVISAALAALPGPEKLWKVRIGLIKLQLASPENIQKGADVIERIGAKLECKYLGCKDEDSKKESK